MLTKTRRRVWKSLKLDEKCILAWCRVLENGPRWLGKREHWGLRWLGGDITMRATGLDQMPHVERDDDDVIIWRQKITMSMTEQMRVLRIRLEQVARNPPTDLIQNFIFKVRMLICLRQLLSCMSRDWLYCCIVAPLPSAWRPLPCAWRPPCHGNLPPSWSPFIQPP